jgi:hypothetical protein
MIDRKMGLNTIILILGDWLTLASFVFIGQLDHGMVGADPLPRLLRTTAELALPWTAVALVWGAYRITAETGGRAFLARSLTAWLIGAPLALLLRAYQHGQATIIVIFMAITMSLGGTFLLGWRTLFFLTWKRFRSQSRERFIQTNT